MDLTKGRQAVERVTNVVFLKACFLMYYYTLPFTDLMSRCFLLIHHLKGKDVVRGPVFESSLGKNSGRFFF